MSYRKDLLQNLRTYLVQFCKKYLNNDYYLLCKKLGNELIHKNIMFDFSENTVRKWAACIIYVICFHNNLLQKEDMISKINNFFEFAAIDVSNKANLLISYFPREDYILNEIVNDEIYFKNPALLNTKIFPNIYTIKYIKKTEDFKYIDFYYRKYPFGSNEIDPKFNVFCESIRQLKLKNSDCIEILFELIKDVFIGNFTIITVPSHDPNNNNLGIKMLAKLLANYNKKINDGTDYLRRVTLIDDHETMSGERTVKTHMNSMCSNPNISIIDKYVLLMDDISTKGNTLRAARAIISMGKPKHIEKFVLAKTYFKNE